MPRIPPEKGQWWQKVKKGEVFPGYLVQNLGWDSTWECDCSRIESTAGWQLGICHRRHNPYNCNDPNDTHHCYDGGIPV